MLSQPTKILIVDDELLIRWSLHEKLTEWGYHALEAENAAQALEKFAREKPAVVLLDIHLPDGSGLDLLRAIKQRRPATGVIMVTAEVSVAYTIAALRGGADDFIGKPLNFDELHFALAQILQKKEPATTSSKTPQPRVLIVAETAEQVTHFTSAFGGTAMELTRALTEADLRQALAGEHDLAIIDVSATALKSVLAALRASPAHAEIPLLVNSTQVVSAPHLSGLLAQYRAMPCSPPELVALARRRLITIAEQTKRGAFLVSSGRVL